jgi:hypothetical protein
VAHNLKPYNFLRAFVLNKFEEKGFLKVWLDGEEERKKENSKYNKNVNTQSFKVPNKFNLDLVISFPGYKTKIKNDKIIYDYRVSLNQIAISHANIVTDLYNKALELKGNSSIINQYLFDLANNGYDYQRENYLKINEIINPPSVNLLDEVQMFHNNLNKKFGLQGNENWSYTLDELSYVIMFIVLQEDINYPPPYYLGRKMPFSRYLEAVFLAQHPDNGVYKLRDVLDRTLVHNIRPEPYKIEGLKYPK